MCTGAVHNTAGIWYWWYTQMLYSCVHLYHTCSRLELYRYSMIIDSSSIFYLFFICYLVLSFISRGNVPTCWQKGNIDFVQVGISEPKLLETGAVGRVQGYKRGRGRGIVQSYIFTRKYSSQPCTILIRILQTKTPPHTHSSTLTFGGWVL